MKRRTFLRGLGSVAVAAPLLGSVGRLLAQPSAPPKRLLIFFQPNGVNMADFFPTVARGPLSAGALAGRSMEPLASFASKLLLPRGLHMSPRGADVDGIAGCDHRKGMSCKLTAAPLLQTGMNLASSHSVDFEAARRINPGGAPPLVLHVGYRVDASTGTAMDFASYEASGTPYPGENNPWNVYRTMMNIGAGSEAEDQLLRRRRSIADLVKEDLQALQRLPMSGDDRHKLSDWLDLLRDTETSITPTGCSSSTPAQLGISGLERYDGSETVGSEAEFREVGLAMVRLSALATVCDVNRVVTLQWSNGSGGPTFRWDGMNHQFTHHQLSHRTGRDDFVGEDLPGVDLLVSEIDRWYGARFAELLTLLDNFKESDGRSTLDHSATVWINELSDGKSHDYANLPIVIAGSAGGYFKQGQVVDCTPTGDYANTREGAPHNKLLTTLLNAVGARADDGGPIESFGDLSYGQPGEYEVLKAG